MVDPRNYTPYYDYSLCKALTALGLHIRWLTSPFIYDELPQHDRLAMEYVFHQPLVIAPGLFRTHPRLRQGLKALTYPADWLRMLARARRERPALVHWQWAGHPTIDTWGLTCLRRLGCYLVYTVHNVLPHEARAGDDVRYARLYHLADALITPSRYNWEQLRAVFQVPEERLHVVPLGNLDDFRGPTLSAPEARRRLGLPAEVPVILFFGLIKPYKGLVYLIRAFAQVRRRWPEALLLIVGRPHGDFRLYQGLIGELKLTQAVHTHLQYVPYHELATWFTAAEAVILPYLATSQSAVLVTAYTFGKPVVATTVGGLAEIVEPGRSGLLVPPGDEDALAEAIMDLLADPGRRAEMGRYARYLAETRYAWPAIARQTLAVYHQIAGL
jgi:glycosyltransferase involved in cell wall biosynthesis